MGNTRHCLSTGSATDKTNGLETRENSRKHLIAIQLCFYHYHQCHIHGSPNYDFNIEGVGANLLFWPIFPRNVSKLKYIEETCR